MKNETKLKNVILDLTQNNVDKGISFGGNLDYGIEEFVGTYVEDGEVYLVTKDSVEMPLYYVAEEIDENIAEDVLESITTEMCNVVDIELMFEY